MNLKIHFIIGIFIFLIPPVAAASSGDACSFLSQAQVSAALGVPVSAGTHVTPTFVKTCTWAPSGGPRADLKYLTLNLQTAEAYASGKKMLEQMKAMATLEKNSPHSMVITPAGGLGEDAYFLEIGNTVSLMVKKGNAAFKIVIYGSLPVEKRRSAEKALALQVLSGF